MKIDWKLFDDKETIIEKKDKLVKYEDGVIYYKDEYGTHRVDLINKIYERINESDIFRVDFTNEILTVKFANTDLKYNINADILKVPHHCSEGSVSENFIKVVSPESAICSAGYMNSYGHPSDKTLYIYNNMNIPFFSTEYNGEIKVRFQDNKIKYKFLNTQYNTIDKYIPKKAKK